MMRVFLLRHAEPDYARDTITTRGHRQARALAEALSSVPIDHLFVSPMGRARATANYIAQRLGIAMETQEWLRELDGNWEGNRWAWNELGVVVEALRCGQFQEEGRWEEVVPYGALMFPQWQALARQFDATLATFGYLREGLVYRVTQRGATTLAFVAHAGTILTLLSHLLNWALPLVYAHFACDVASITELQWREHEGYALPQLVRLNDTSHWRKRKEG